MRIMHISANQREEWNGFAAKEPSFALLQSWEWGEFKEKLGWKVYRIAVEEEDRIAACAQLLIKSFVRGSFSIAYVPRGPLCDWSDQEMTSCLLAELHRTAKLHRAVFLKIEPPLIYNSTVVRSLEHYGFSPSHLTNQPGATIIVDLKMDVDNIFQQLRKRTREYIKYSEKQGVTVRIGRIDDLPEFTRIMRTTAQREHFHPHTRDYYEHEWQTFYDLQQTVLLMAYYQEQLLAVHMAFRFGNHAAYFHGGSSSAFGNLRSNSLLVWEAIKWAKAQDCMTYDLWGIPDEVGQAVSEGKEPPVSNRTDGLWGVYHFKRGFSKNIVGYIGSWDYVYNSMFYPLITNKYLNFETVNSFLAMIDSLRRN